MIMWLPQCGPHRIDTLKHTDDRLLLKGGIVQSVPCNCDHFLIYCVPHLSTDHSQFNHHSSLLCLQQRHLVTKQGETGREIATVFCVSVSIIPYGIFNILWNLAIWGRCLYFLSEKKSYYRFLSPLKIHCFWPGLNSQTLGPVASTITITPLRTTDEG
jgi:hypothetical protein